MDGDSQGVPMMESEDEETKDKSLKTGCTNGEESLNERSRLVNSIE